uniref:SNF2 subfamily protein n=1 Tax=Marseillevirus LCMAC201 TaxID=2506605 RepID=A0A481YW90_9VIRU|nr:MAG: SNF2 subfamily protein [Marseillevirus LCMAC201]
MTAIPIINGDLATAPADLIVQQCNCLTVKAHGLSEYLGQKLGANPYQKRKAIPGRRNLAIKENRTKIGTIRIYSRKKTRPFHVACLFSQFTPGKPNVFYQDVCTDHDIVDDAANRIEWFKQCLQLLVKKIDSLGCKTVAFPYGLGCGLAGGDWKVYSSIITDWAHQHTDLKVIFMKIT